jgi:hypothetical protein
MGDRFNHRSFGRGAVGAEWAPLTLVAWAIGACFGLCAAGQTPTSEEVIASARRAYGAGVYAESLVIEATDGLGRTERSEIVVRVRPIEQGTDVAEVVAELGRLRVWAGNGEVIATHQTGGGSWWGERTEGPAGPLEMIEQTLPRIVAPSIAILRGDTSWTPVTGRVVWNGVVEDPAGGGWLLAGKVIDERSGQPGDLAIQAAFDRESSRLERLIVSGPGASGLQRLAITMASVEPGDPTAWKPVTDPASRRDSLAGIVGTRARLGTGDRFPHVVWVRADGGAWRLEVAPDASAPTTVFVLFRASAEPGENAAAIADARACVRVFVDRVRVRQRESIGHGGAGAPSPKLVCGAVFAIDAFDADRFGAITGELSDLLVDEPGVVWTSPATSTIDAMAPDAGAVLCIVDGAGSVRSIVVIDGIASGEASATAAVERAADEAMGTDPTGGP